MTSMLDYIKKLADIIRQSLNLPNDACITEKTLEELLQNLGGKITYKKLDRDIEGRIIKGKNNKFQIVVNENIPQKEMCLKIAEELGHLFLHMGFIIDDEQWEKSNEYVDSVYHRIGYSKEAYEANYFARVLLKDQEELRQLSY